MLGGRIAPSAAVMALTNVTAREDMVREVRVLSESGSEVRVVYETDVPEPEENAIEGMPSLDASEAAPLK